MMPSDYVNVSRGSHGLGSGHSGVDSPISSEVEARKLLSTLEVSIEHAQILRVMDELRNIGIGKGRSVHSIPQIIVCGSQSSGKSSVLEAISGIPFPRKAELCTRYKTRVTILRKPIVSATLRIEPDPSRTSSIEIDSLRRFTRKLESNNWKQDISTAMEEANLLIFSGSKERNKYTNDTLSITITDPFQQDLELLDLPGLINVDTNNDKSPDMVKQMVINEMKKRHSIVLAISRATDDLEHHEILQMCKDYKVDSRRTLGILTMPDLANTRANTYANIVQGLDKQFKELFPLDWHVLQNGSDDERSKPDFERDANELNFFKSEVPWNQIPSEITGIEELRYRLSTLLFTVARRELPKLFQSMREREKVLKKEMNSLGGDLCEKDLRRAFKKSVDRLKQKSMDHARGIYESDIRKYPGSHAVHLRSRVVEQSEVFRDELLKSGHEWDLEGRIPNIDPDSDLQSIYRPVNTNSRQITVKSEDEAVREFAELLNSMRSRGLPGYDNQGVVHKAFWLLSEGWKGIAEAYVERIFHCCDSYFDSMIPVYFAKPETTTSPSKTDGFGNFKIVASRFRRKYLTPELDKKREEALNELMKLEQDRLDTCQNADREFLSKLRAEREKRHMKRAMDLLHHSGDLADKSEVEPADIGKLLSLHTLEDWTAETAKDSLSALWEHYKVCAGLLNYL